MKGVNVGFKVIATHLNTVSQIQIKNIKCLISDNFSDLKKGILKI
jgi:hypothetical protein